MTKSEQKVGIFGGMINDLYPFGYQEIVKFSNGFSASVIRGDLSHDLWEVAIFNKANQLTYETDLTNDVERFESEGEVIAFLVQIAELDENGKRRK